MALRPLDLPWALHSELPPLDFVLPGLLPGGLGLLVAPGGTGKSFLALDIAISLSIGRAIADGLFPASTSRRVVYLAGEESDRLLAERLRNTIDLADRSLLNPSNLILLPMTGEDCRLVSQGKPTELLSELKERAHGSRLIIVDPIRRFHDGDENDSSAMTQLVVVLESLAKHTGAAVLAVHHANRASASDAGSQHASRGSSALVDGARWQLNLSLMDEKTATTYGLTDAERLSYIAVDIAKSNYLPSKGRSWLKRRTGGGVGLVRLDTVQAKTKRNNLGGARLIP